jgi:transcriptional regulator with XRE-family HTH domain
MCIGMRISPLKHNVARLRTLDFVKLGQKELADLAGCSTRTIQSVELNTLKLSEDLARRISNVTGIAVDWLLENDLEAKPISKSRRPYTRKDYEHSRTAHDLGISSDQAIALLLGKSYATVFSAWMRAIFVRRIGGDVALWKVGKLLEQLAERYGHDRSIVPRAHLRFADLRDAKIFDEHVKTGVRLSEKFAIARRGRKLRRGKHGGWRLPAGPRKRARGSRRRR